MTLTLFLLACDTGGPGSSDGGGNDDGTYDTGGDDEAPVIEHTPVTTSMPMGEAIPLTALVTDDSAVFAVYLNYKAETGGSADWITLAMALTGNEDEYAGMIPAEDLDEAGINYYLEALDISQNVSYAPTGGASDPYHVRLYPPEE